MNFEGKIVGILKCSNRSLIEQIIVSCEKETGIIVHYYHFSNVSAIIVYGDILDIETVKKFLKDNVIKFSSID